MGHEIVGTAVRVGANVTHVKQGDRVGVGAQARSCLEADCPECSTHKESYCGRGVVNTYGSVYPGDEGKSYGGYADYNRTNGHFVIPIPEGLASEVAAPMLYVYDDTSFLSSSFFFSLGILRHIHRTTRPC